MYQGNIFSSYYKYHKYIEFMLRFTVHGIITVSHKILRTWKKYLYGIRKSNISLRVMFK